MPEQLQVRSSVGMEERARGLHKVNTFNLKTHLTAQWAGLASLQAHSTVSGSRLQCGAPIVMVAVGDARGIRTAQVSLGEQALALKPGTFHPTYSRGCTRCCPKACAPGRALTLALDLELVGTERLSIVPLGGNTDVKMTGSWPHPRSTGGFAVRAHLGPEGFTAQWRLSSLATTAQQDVQAGRRICAGSYDDAPPSTPRRHHPARLRRQLWRGLCGPGEPYTLADRATKYGLLFIALTFVAVGLFELMEMAPRSTAARSSLPPRGPLFRLGAARRRKGCACTRCSTCWWARRCAASSCCW